MEGGEFNEEKRTTPGSQKEAGGPKSDYDGGLVIGRGVVNNYSEECWGLQNLPRPPQTLGILTNTELGTV